MVLPQVVGKLFLLRGNMSRSTVSGRKESPVSKYVNFNGSTGEFYYYDSDNKGNVSLGTELKFVLLDSRSCVTGWNDEENSRVYSNQVRSIKTEPLAVRTKKGVLVEGLWEDIKASVSDNGGSFTVNIYGKLAGTNEIVCLPVKKSELKEWAEFVAASGRSIYDFLVVATKSDQRKKGAVKFHVPLFSKQAADEAELENATNIDKFVLQPYFSGEKVEQEIESTNQQLEEASPF